MRAEFELAVYILSRNIVDAANIMNNRNKYFLGVIIAINMNEKTNWITL